MEGGEAVMAKMVLAEEQKMQIGGRIQMHRERIGMKQWQLAEYLDVSDNAISNVETGSSTCSIAMLLQLSSLFGCSIDYLLTGKEHETNELVNRVAHLGEKEQKQLLQFLDIYHLNTMTA